MTFEFRAEMLNALNSRYFSPANNTGTPLGITTAFAAPGGPIAADGTPLINSVAGTSADSFRLTQLLGDNTARIVQPVWRVRW